MSTFYYFIALLMSPRYASSWGAYTVSALPNRNASAPLRHRDHGLPRYLYASVCVSMNLAPLVSFGISYILENDYF